MQACAVIGCGPAGIAASTRLRQSGLLVTCFELAPGPGGIWLSNSRDLYTGRGLVSPIYPSMRCVLPKDLMSYSDVRFDYTVPQFPHHSAVQHYLERSAEQKGVRGLTRFNTKVESARFDEKDGLWKLITVNVKSGDVMEWAFDKVCVCTGQTHEPRYPGGLKEMFAPYVADGGEVHHSSHVKDFRSLRNKRVVVVGDGVSAYDYCMELKRFGAEVYHSTTLRRGEDDGGASLSSALFEDAAATSGAIARREKAQRLHGSLFRKSTTDKAAGWEGEAPPADLVTSLLALSHKLPGRRDNVHQANEIIRRWLRYRSAHMEGIPRVGSPVGCEEGRGVVFEEDPTRTFSTEDAVGEARQRRLANANAKDEGKAGAAKGVHIGGIDAVISATGYTHRFPFLHKDLRRVVEAEEQLMLSGGAVAPSGSGGGGGGATASERQSRRGLYLGTILAERPSLAFVGLQRELLPPFLMFEAQCRFVSYAFSQRMPLPATAAEMEAQESKLVEANPMLRDLYSGRGLGLHSAAYFNTLEQQLGISSRDTYTSMVMVRRWWLSASSGLRVYHKFRSWAPLKRKEQHLLFSNKI